MAFFTPIDIAKRVCQHLEQPIITLFTDDTPVAQHINAAYDHLRLAELSRHTWAFSIRRSRVRPITTTTQIWTPPAWNVATNYTAGAVVMSLAGTYANGANYPWVLQAPTSVGQNPEITPAWSHYFGTFQTDVFDPGATYSAGEVVVEPALYAGGTTYSLNALVRDSNGAFWVSLQGANTGNTPSSSPTFWAAWVFPSSGNPSTTPNIIYQPSPATQPTIWLSLLNQNGPSSSGVPALLPSAALATSWTNVGGTLQQLAILFPLGTGPFSVNPVGTVPIFNNSSANLFKLPFGWLREATVHIEGKRAKHPWLGALYGRLPLDFVYQGAYISTWGAGPYDLDFVADIADVSLMPPDFCESLAIRIGLEIDGPITGSKNTSKLEAEYKRITGEAMRIDMILQGEEANELDELILVRF